MEYAISEECGSTLYVGLIRKTPTLINKIIIIIFFLTAITPDCFILYWYHIEALHLI